MRRTDASVKLSTFRTNNYPQRSRLDTYLNRRPADIFAIGVDLERRLSFYACSRRLEILHFADAKMPAKVDRRKQASQLEGIDTANHANVKPPVIHSRPRRDFHSAAVSRSVGKRG